MSSADVETPNTTQLPQKVNAERDVVGEVSGKPPTQLRARSRVNTSPEQAGKIPSNYLGRPPRPAFSAIEVWLEIQCRDAIFPVGQCRTAAKERQIACANPGNIRPRVKRVRNNLVNACTGTADVTSNPAGCTPTQTQAPSVECKGVIIIKV